MLFVNKNFANQPVHLHSLINAFVVHLLDSIKHILAKYQFQVSSTTDQKQNSLFC